MKIISNIKKLDASKRLNFFRILALILFSTIVISHAWLSDDAYHAYTMAKNFVEGHGFVYNIGEQANSATCPLFTLIVAGVYLITQDMYISGMLTCIVFSVLAFYILAFKICKSPFTVVISTIILVCSSSFISYTTSGLENSLIFFLSAIYLFVFFKSKKYNRKELFVLALMEGLIATTRMDVALLFALPSVYAFVCCREEIRENTKSGILYQHIIPLIKSLPLALAGLSPFIFWELFSIVYYGFFVPNTAFAKLNSGFPLIDYLIRGCAYIVSSGIFDILVVIVPLLYVIYTFVKKVIGNQYRILALGVVIYLLYIIYIGGDFMAGRLLTVPMFISLVGLVSLFEHHSSITSSQKVKTVISIILISLLFVNLFFGISIDDDILYGGKSSANHPYLSGVADERSYYYDFTNLGIYLNWIMDGSKEPSPIEKRWSSTEVDSAINRGVEGAMLSWAPGILVYYKGETLLLSDPIGLGDPFLSKLPAHYSEYWRIGHMKRDIPTGYAETLSSGINLIENPYLHEYYEKLSVIIKGGGRNLLDVERLKIIIEMNLGKYDYLLDEYTKTLTTIYRG